MVFPLAGTAHDHELPESLCHTEMYRLGEVVRLLVGTVVNDRCETLPVLRRNGVTVTHDGVGQASPGDEIVGCPVGADDIGGLTDQ